MLDRAQRLLLQILDDSPQAGFRLCEFRLLGPGAEDLAELKRTRVHPSFSRYSEQDLAARGVFFVAEKP